MPSTQPGQPGRSPNGQLPVQANGAKTPIARPAHIPAYAQGQGSANAFNSAFCGDMPDSIPFGVVRLGGKVWAWSYQGESAEMEDEQGEIRPYIDVVFLGANDRLSRQWWPSGYVEGERSPPSCLSINGDKPDARSPDRQNPICGTCRHNAWGSAGRETSAKACQSHRRTALVPANDLQNEKLGGPMLLSLPIMSAKNMKGFAQEMQQQGVDLRYAVVRLRFDSKQKMPVVLFQFKRWLEPEEIEAVQHWWEDPLTKRIINPTFEDLGGGQAEPAAEPAEDTEARGVPTPPAHVRQHAAQARAQAPSPTQAKSAPARPAAKPAVATKSNRPAPEELAEAVDDQVSAEEMLAGLDAEVGEAFDS